VTATAMINPTSLDGSELYLDAGLPGFPGAHRFRLQPWGDPDGPFSLLVCLDADELAFVVVRPEPFFPEYTPQIARPIADRLGLVRAADAVVYVIVTLGPTPLDATVNLLGPLVVNRRNQLAAQVVLDGDSSDVRTPLMGASAQAS
jgi:flagellar assembly factor FliW